jgi:hypothetical protein
VRRDPPLDPHGEGPKAYVAKRSYNLGAWSEFIMCDIYVEHASAPPKFV